MHIFHPLSLRCSRKGIFPAAVHENIFDFHLCRGKLNSQTIIDWRCKNMFNPPITDRKAPAKKITSWRFAIEIFVTFAFWDFRNFWLCSLQRAKMSPRRQVEWDRRELNERRRYREMFGMRNTQIFLIQLSFQSVSNDSEEIHHESAENIIVDDSADMKPFFHDSHGSAVSGSNVNWCGKTGKLLETSN